MIKVEFKTFSEMQWFYREVIMVIRGKVEFKIKKCLSKYMLILEIEK